MVLVGLCIVLTLFTGRLVQLQGVDAAAYAARAKTLTTVTLQATRGTITDRNGAALATTVDARNVTVDQTLVTDPAGEAAKLAPLLHIDAATLQERLSGTRRFVYLAKQISPETWRTIDGLNLPGVFDEKTSRRVYPAGTLAANVVGFVGADGKGLAGLEYSMQRLLSGKDGKAIYESAGGRAIPTSDNSTVAPVPGTDVNLTIDRDIQWRAQQAIAAKVKETKSESGTVVVMDPRTGEVLALATAPTFDPNNPSAAKPQDRGNRSLSEAYEPGSTGKLITAAALLESGVVTPETKLTVPNRLTRAGKSFKDWENHGTQKLTYAGSIARSSNIGTILAAEKLGDLTKLYPWFRKFGIGQRLAMDFPGATPGSLLPPSQWSKTTPYTMTFGQGYSVNTVQMASVVATIANNGVRVAPTLVRSYVGPDGKVTPRQAPAKTRVMSDKTAKTIAYMMEGVTGKGGTAPSANIPGYRVAGKTGTAQRYNADCGCYRGYTMSFIGFAPADNPRLVVAVTLQGPKLGSGGGSTGGPVFHDVMSFALQTQRVPPTGAPAPQVQIFWK